jgi:lipopolysaccharide/colanic/teichoic acid biosynthesis glycosyltransferase
VNGQRDSAADRVGHIVGVAFSRLQDVVYAALGLLLFVSAILVASVVILRRSEAR